MERVWNYNCYNFYKTYRPAIEFHLYSTASLTYYCCILPLSEHIYVTGEQREETDFSYLVPEISKQVSHSHLFL